MLRSTSPVRYHAEIMICFPKKTFKSLVHFHLQVLRSSAFTSLVQRYALFSQTIDNYWLIVSKFLSLTNQWPLNFTGPLVWRTQLNRSCFKVARRVAKWHHQVSLFERTIYICWVIICIMSVKLGPWRRQIQSDVYRRKKHLPGTMSVYGSDRCSNIA